MRKSTASWFSYRCPSKLMPIKSSLRSILPKTWMDSIRSTRAGSPAACRPWRRAHHWAACSWPRHVNESLAGLEAVVIGRSNIVGKPVAQLLLAENATVTIAHSKTNDLPSVCRRADLLVAAIGRPEMVRGDWIKPGATVIDVGINRVPREGGKSRIVGDVAYGEAANVAGAITPVPGGVGPMTIACLLLNTLRAACAQKGLPAPKV